MDTSSDSYVQIVTLEDTLQKVRQIVKKIGSKINKLAFSDDFTLVADNKEDLEELTKVFI